MFRRTPTPSSSRRGLRRRTYKSTEELSQELVDVGQLQRALFGDPSRVGEEDRSQQQSAPHYSSSSHFESTSSLSVPVNPGSTCPYEAYNQEIYSFHAAPSPWTEPKEALREFMEALSARLGNGLQNAAFRMPLDEIPAGNWTIGYAPRLLQSGAWAVVFRSAGSETVWFWWPFKSTDVERHVPDDRVEEGCDAWGDAKMEDYLSALVEENTMRIDREADDEDGEDGEDGAGVEIESMKVGGAGHRKFHALVTQALWRSETRQVDAGEWSHVVV